MLFDSLDKLKRNSIISAILLITLGVVILLCPPMYITTLVVICGYSLVVIGIVMMLDFFSGKKSFMEYIKLVCALVLLIIGLAVLVFKSNIMLVLAELFGFLIVLDGARTMFHSFTYVRRSKRKSWWVLTILSALLIFAGIVLFINPWCNTLDRLMKVIGCAVLFSAAVSTVRLFWTWPLRNSKGGNDDGEE